jgi:hypothetical protein
VRRHKRVRGSSPPPCGGDALFLAQKQVATTIRFVESVGLAGRGEPGTVWCY